ncbi:MAG: hypothetical protein AcusKO_24590 [Acuticoccus sp.]
MAARDIGGRSAGQQAIGDIEIDNRIEVDIDVADDGFDGIEIDIHIGFHGTDDGQIDSGIDGEVAVLTIGRCVIGVLRGDCGENIGGRSAGQQAIGDVEIGDGIEVDIDVTDDGLDGIEIDVHIGFHGTDDGQIDSGIDGEVAVLTIGRCVIGVLRGDCGENIGGRSAGQQAIGDVEIGDGIEVDIDVTDDGLDGIEIDVHIGFHGTDDGQIDSFGIDGEVAVLTIGRCVIGVLRGDGSKDIGGRSAGQQAIGDVEIGDGIEVDIDVTDDGLDGIEIDVHIGFHGTDDGQIDSGIDGEVAVLSIIGRSVVGVLRAIAARISAGAARSAGHR